jgi:hypothetical protein
MVVRIGLCRKTTSRGRPIRGYIRRFLGASVVSLLLLATFLPTFATEPQGPNNRISDRPVLTGISIANKNSEELDDDDELSGTITVVEAVFRGAACHPIKAIKELCDGKSRCGIEINDRLCDAASPLNGSQSGLIVSLSVSYRCGLGERLRIAKTEQPFRLILRCQW